ncbi:uncharacterized protein PHACADRAFT_214442 [Phanerochaete carnosa HHB-10118-sp]|uniref:Uncharacterized protein n=1 Tax=Phanerochaete carnosa (strain HHB-10118-sp) TaxID=650164 RepID=K5VRS0_PHACS|nr:uncharacterized protein PHACADRAFT_214442 [Phanerochaete carnosa HHB-10118-sp]EKM49269.1 hypothetical protein PHACADRAFT_214442 [Phanerochaete carnosa HHB-10118-sp]
MFTKATRIPAADFHDLSCDPGLQATLTAETIIEQPSNPIPVSGFLLSVWLRDEDLRSYDIDLSKVALHMPSAEEGALAEGWRSGSREYKADKRKMSIMSKLLRKYIRYLSPLIGKFLSSSNSPDSGDRNTVVKPAAFVANCLQLAGPVPSLLHHRYVNSAPFVKGLFRKRGHALHKQHMEGEETDRAQDREGTKNEGSVDGKDEKISNDFAAMTRQSLRIMSCGTNNRRFTYDIMLDGKWRSIVRNWRPDDHGVPSKYTPCTRTSRSCSAASSSCASPAAPSHRSQGPVARRLARPSPSPQNMQTDTHGHDPPAPHEFVNDNDSGTHRPCANLLRVLHAYLVSPHNLDLGALGHVTTLNAFGERLKRWRDAR